MLAALPAVALFFSILKFVGAQDGGSSIPGLTEGQQTCLANCLFFGVPAATDCPQPQDSNDDPDLACFCSSKAFIANVTQCASTGCNICTTGGCNITASPLTDACGSNTTGSGSISNSASASRTTPGSGSSGSSTVSLSGSTSSPSGSGAPNSAQHFTSLQRATILVAVLVFLGLAM
ncbi:hypothetical protein MVEN_02331100 [Mycena venus]|uniref:Extracellular membrane protein CFEM domain-containing protein n=1 Tax=Mycena venus TaxID=2733690 RepID=A0A8H7CE09_9AGAR|nr:hypothetical protein MVEN_02331100 [Mycena venus]